MSKFLNVDEETSTMTKVPKANTIRKAAKRAVDLAISKGPGPELCYFTGQSGE